MPDRLKPILIAFALGVCLVAPSPPSLPGDGGEYLVLALNFARLRGPSILPADLPGYTEQLRHIRPDIGEIDTHTYMREARDGTLDFLHFWFYSMLATPGIWLATLVGAPSVAAFALLNLSLILFALRISLPRLGTAVCLLIFASPIVWWLDKPHTEPYTFALLILAMVLFYERPWWSMVAAGAAAVQNPVAFTFLGLMLLGGALQGRHVFLDRRWLAGAAAGLALASLHVLYFWVRYRTPSLLVLTTQSGSPHLTEILVPLMDLNLGLLPNFPALGVAVVIALGLVAWRRPRALLQLDVLISLSAAIAFLVSFARNTNYHHGGTPSLSRYGLWLIPLAIPLLRLASTAAGGWWHRAIWGLSVASAMVSVYVFHPIVKENSREPTWLAESVWTRHPLWNNPLPQIFIESQRHTESLAVPIATAGCEKILLSGRRNEGAWPIPCYPPPIPPWCQDNFCYANLVGGRYVFSHVPGRDHGPGDVLSGEVWPLDAEPHVRNLYDRLSWRAMKPRLEPDPMVRQVHNMRASFLQGAPGTIVVLQRVQRGAFLALRPPGRYTATLFNPATGEMLRTSTFEGPAFERWEIAIPEGSLLLLSLIPQPSGG